MLNKFCGIMVAIEKGIYFMVDSTLVPSGTGRSRHYGSLKGRGLPLDPNTHTTVNEGTIKGTTAHIATTTTATVVSSVEKSQDKVVDVSSGVLQVAKPTVKAVKTTAKVLNVATKLEPLQPGAFSGIVGKAGKFAPTVQTVENGLVRLSNKALPTIKAIGEHPAVETSMRILKPIAQGGTVTAVVLVSGDGLHSFSNASQLRGVSRYKQNREGVEKLITGYSGIGGGMAMGAGGGALGGSAFGPVGTFVGGFTGGIGGGILGTKTGKMIAQKFVDSHAGDVTIDNISAIETALSRVGDANDVSAKSGRLFMVKQWERHYSDYEKALASGDRNQAQLQATIYNNYLMHAGSANLNGGVALLTPDEVKQADHFARADFAAAEKTGFHGVPSSTPSSAGTLSVAHSKTDVAQSGYNDAKGRLVVLAMQHQRDDAEDAKEMAQWRKQHPRPGM